MMLKYNAITIALFLASADCFVTNPMRAGTLPYMAFASTRRFASNVSLPAADEVQRLKEKAAQLRQEAAGLEAEQKANFAKAAESVFRKFDKDEDGEISVEELKAGLEKIFKMELPDVRADQLVKEFDANGDGSLQLDEFAGIDKFRNKLETLIREEKDLARQQAKEAQAAAEKAELAQTRMELVNDKPPTTGDKIISVLPYLFPLLDGLQFGRFFIEGHQENPLAIAATLAYVLYRSIPFGGFISFFGLNLLSNNPKINRLIRFNAQQAVFLDFFLFVPALVLTLGAGLLSLTGLAIPPVVTELGSDALFLTLLVAVAYSAVSSLSGETPNKLPFISQRVEDRMIPSELFDVAPLNENKKSNKNDDDTN